MTSAESRPARPAGSPDEYNLAEQVYGVNDHLPEVAEEDHSGTNGSKVRRVPMGRRAPPRSSLLTDNRIPTSQGNLAASVYRNSILGRDANGAADSALMDTAPGGFNGYNLAERIYGNGSGHDTNGNAYGASNEYAPDSGRYNLSERVYRNGNVVSLGKTSDLAIAAPQPVVPVTKPPRKGISSLVMSVLAPGTGRRGGVSTGQGLASRTFDSLQVKSFRWFMLAMLGQFAAMNMQMLVRGYLVFELTGSFAALGAMSLGNAVPMLVFSLAGGVLADRAPRKMVLSIGQLANAVLASVIAVLLFTDTLRFEHLFASAVVQGFVWSMMMPARQAMIPELVGEERLMNAVSLNVAGMNFMRLVAPGVGGLMIAILGGADWVYVVIVASFLFATITLLPVPSKPGAATSRRAAGGHGGGGGMGGGMGGPGAGSFSDLADGLRYAVRNRNVLALLVVNLVIVLFSMPYMMLLPGFVADVLGGGAEQLGMLMTVSGGGALAGSLVIAAMPSRNRGRLLLISSLVLGISLVVFSASTWLWLTTLIMIVVGVAQTGRMSLSNVLLQAYVEDAYRGRVMSLYMMEFGIVSFGVFFVGLLAGWIGAQWAIGGTAVALIIVSLGVLVFSPRLRNLD